MAASLLPRWLTPRWLVGPLLSLCAVSSAWAAPPAEPPPELVAAAAASPRSPQCGTTDEAWSRSLHSVSQYCALLARGYSVLATDPKLAVELAQRAGKLSAGAPAAVLEGRALVALGRFADGHQRFEQALQTERLLSTAALHDRAVAAYVSGQYATAVAAFEKLLPRVRLLSSERQARVYLEATFARVRAKHAGVQMNQLATRQVSAYVNQALALSGQRGTLPFAQAARLLLTKLGEAPHVGADAESMDVGALQRAFEKGQLSAVVPRLQPADGTALLAAAQLAEDEEAARQTWSRYLKQDPNGPFAALAGRRGRGARR